MVHPALSRGNSAVITGSAFGGIGYSIASICLHRFGMKVLLVDISASSLDLASKELIKLGVDQENFETCVCDVADLDQMIDLADKAFEKFKGKIDLLVLNAGVQMATKDFTQDPKASLKDWNKTLNVNLFGVLHGTQVFTERMVQQDSPAAIVCTGSKQGITQPPGNPAYNVSKSAVKSITEALAHSLLSTKVTAHLLIPGYTWSKLTTNDKILEQGPDEKPKAAWSSDQVAEELFARIENEFYIICPDNDVTWALDKARMSWNFGDLLEKRPALSRWNPEYKTAFDQHVQHSLAAEEGK